MTLKKQLFCNYFVQLQNHKEAAIRAGYDPKEADDVGMKLLMQKAVKKQIKKQIDNIILENQNNNLLQKSISGFERLAFGSVTDSIKLISGEFPEDLKSFSQLDLFNISEIKRSQNGTVEVKFFDRLKALEKIYEISKMELDSSQSLDLIDAIRQSAQAISNSVSTSSAVNSLDLEKNNLDINLDTDDFKTNLVDDVGYE